MNCKITPLYICRLQMTHFQLSFSHIYNDKLISEDEYKIAGEVDGYCPI